MQIRIGVVLALGLAVSACAGGAGTTPPPESASYTPPPKRNLKPAEAVEEAKRAVAAKMKDPESARFADVAHRVSPNARGEPTDVVCGMVNAKNSFGGYTGARPFVYMVDLKQAQLTEGDRLQAELGMTIYKNFCAGGFAAR